MHRFCSVHTNIKLKIEQKNARKCYEIAYRTIRHNIWDGSTIRACFVTPIQLALHFNAIQIQIWSNWIKKRERMEKQIKYLVSFPVLNAMNFLSLTTRLTSIGHFVFRGIRYNYRIQVRDFIEFKYTVVVLFCGFVVIRSVSIDLLIYRSFGYFSLCN